MSAWRRVAIEKMPNLTRHIATSQNGYDLWINLWFELTQIYERQPLDDPAIAAIYSYGRWCLGDARNADLATGQSFVFMSTCPPTHECEPMLVGGCPCRSSRA